jgi:hypothetical protein
MLASPTVNAIQNTASKLDFSIRSYLTLGKMKVESYCIGADTAQMAHLEAGLRGAEFWLKHVLSECKSHNGGRKAAEQWSKE